MRNISIFARAAAAWLFQLWLFGYPCGSVWIRLVINFFLALINSYLRWFTQSRLTKKHPNNVWTGKLFLPIVAGGRDTSRTQFKKGDFSYTPFKISLPSSPENNDSVLFQHIFKFVVRQRHLAAVVIITAARRMWREAVQRVKTVT